MNANKQTIIIPQFFIVYLNDEVPSFSHTHKRKKSQVNKVASSAVLENYKRNYLSKTKSSKIIKSI